jgi:hypothetical protein
MARKDGWIGVFDHGLIFVPVRERIFPTGRWCTPCWWRERVGWREKIMRRRCGVGRRTGPPTSVFGRENFELSLLR